MADPYFQLNIDQIQKVLQQIDYPATKQDIVDFAEAEGVDTAIIDLFQNLPDQEYASSEDVLVTLSEF